MFAYLNRCIRYWPFRCGATGIDDYLMNIDVDYTKPKGEKDLLLTLELLINLLYWAPKQDYNDTPNVEIIFADKKNEVRSESERLICNAQYILEQCCDMCIRTEEDDIFPKYYISRRNADVDAAVKAVPELSDVLLAYHDIRNEDDIDYKKSALTTIYQYLEPRRKEYKSMVCSAVSEEFFSCMNCFGIRHNTKCQVKIQYDKKKTVCDKLFMMAIFVLQTESVTRIKNEMKALREE